MGLYDLVQEIRELGPLVRDDYTSPRREHFDALLRQCDERREEARDLGDKVRWACSALNWFGRHYLPTLKKGRLGKYILDDKGKMARGKVVERIAEVTDGLDLIPSQNALVKAVKEGWLYERTKVDSHGTYRWTNALIVGYLGPRCISDPFLTLSNEIHERMWAIRVEVL